MRTPKKILVPTDFSVCSKTGLLRALRMARAYGGKVIVVHVVDTSGQGVAAIFTQGVAHRFKEMTLRIRDQLMERFFDGANDESLIAQTIVLQGDPAREIARFAREEAIDIIVMGTHERRRFGHVFSGSVAARVARLAPCPVLAVKRKKAGVTRLAATAGWSSPPRKNSGVRDHAPHLPS